MDTPQLPQGSRVLRLPLKKAPFDVMVTGEKKQEFRRLSNWITSRLGDKQYDYALFTNGYGADKPWFLARFVGYDLAINDWQEQYSNGLIVAIEEGMVIINLGPVVQSGNLRP